MAKTKPVAKEGPKPPREGSRKRQVWDRYYKDGREPARAWLAQWNTGKPVKTGPNPPKKKVKRPEVDAV